MLTSLVGLRNRRFHDPETQECIVGLFHGDLTSHRNLRQSVRWSRCHQPDGWSARRRSALSFPSSALLDAWPESRIVAGSRATLSIIR
jgi:hypothetical protein